VTMGRPLPDTPEDGGAGTRTPRRLLVAVIVQAVVLTLALVALFGPVTGAHAHRWG